MKFLNDIVLTGAGADLTAPAAVTFSGLSTTTETSAVVVNSSGVLSKRVLGSNAFTSDTVAAPTSLVTSVVNDTINVTFTASTTTDVSQYLVFSSVAGGDYGLISVIPP